MIYGNFRQYERALNTCGMEFRSDALWEHFINFETENKKLKRVFGLYARILQVPTRLFNRHWDKYVDSFHLPRKKLITILI